MIKKLKAYSVHFLTGLGIIMSFFSIISILNGDKLYTFIFMSIALFIDVIDGSLARKFNVKKYVPNIDGQMLDSLVDYINYVLIPCIILYEFEYIPKQFNLIIPILILTISLYSFSYKKIITDDHTYVGFPSIWNVIIIYLTILNLNVWINFYILISLIILKIVPIKVIHPMRFTSHKIKNSIFALSLIFISIILLINIFHKNLFEQYIFILYFLWYILNSYFVVFIILLNFKFNYVK